MRKIDLEGLYSLLNNETGEIQSIKPKRKRKKTAVFALYFPTNNSVLDYLLYYMTSENVSVLENRTEIEQELKISQREFTRDIKKLMKDDILIRLANSCYMINPNKYLKTSRKNKQKYYNVYLLLKNRMLQNKLTEKEKQLIKEKAGNKLIDSVNKILSENDGTAGRI